MITRYLNGTNKELTLRPLLRKHQQRHEILIQDEKKQAKQFIELTEIIL